MNIQRQQYVARRGGRCESNPGGRRIEESRALAAHGMASCSSISRGTGLLHSPFPISNSTYTPLLSLESFLARDWSVTFS